MCLNFAVIMIAVVTFGLVNRSFVNLISDSDSDFENDPSVQRILFTSSNMKEETDRYIKRVYMHMHENWFICEIINTVFLTLAT